MKTKGGVLWKSKAPENAELDHSEAQHNEIVGGSSRDRNGINSEKSKIQFN